MPSKKPTNIEDEVRSTAVGWRSDRPPKLRDQDPNSWASHQAREREHRAVDGEGEALAECYWILMDAGAIKPKVEEKR